MLTSQGTGHDGNKFSQGSTFKPEGQKPAKLSLEWPTTMSPSSPSRSSHSDTQPTTLPSSCPSRSSRPASAAQSYKSVRADLHEAMKPFSPTAARRLARPGSAPAPAQIRAPATDLGAMNRRRPRSATESSQDGVANMLNYIMLAKLNKERLDRGASPHSLQSNPGYTPLHSPQNRISRPSSAGCSSPSSPSKTPKGFSLQSSLPKALGRPMSAGCLRQAPDTFSFADCLTSVAEKKSGKQRPRSAGAISTSKVGGSRPLSGGRPRRRKVVRSTTKISRKSFEAVPLTEEELAWVAATLGAVPRVSTLLNAASELEFNETGAAALNPNSGEPSQEYDLPEPCPHSPTRRRGSVSWQIRSSISSLYSVAVPEAKADGPQAMKARRQSIQERRKPREVGAAPPSLSAQHMAKAGKPEEGGSDIHSHRLRVMKRMEAGEDGFEEEDVDRLRGAFVVHVPPGSKEVFAEDLLNILAHLGHHTAKEDQVQEICKDVHVYNALSFGEFMNFMTRYVEVERAEFRQVFEACDLDANDRLLVDELEGLCVFLGINPFRDALLESLRFVDNDLSGHIDVDQFLELMSLLQVTEGFSHSEIERLRRIFDRFAQPIISRNSSSALLAETHHEAIEMSADRLIESLVQMFGPHTEATATSMVHSLLPPGRRADGVTFQNFLVWARRQRVTGMQESRERFEEADADNSGLVDGQELAQLIYSLGYTPLKRVVEEALREVTGSPDAELDFEEFMKVMDLFHRRDGFTQAEVDNFEEIFESFLEPGYEEMGCLELLNLIRHLGFAPKLSEVHKYIDTVDLNCNHTMDFREFLGLMHTQREEELHRARIAFDVFDDEDGKELRSDALRAAMLATDVRWSKLPRETFETMLRERGNPETLSFDTFADIIQKGRSILAMEMRQQAGFCSKEIEQFKELFASYDLDKNGTIERSELASLLTALGIPMRTWSDQHAMITMLRKAKSLAQEAGLEFDDEQVQDTNPQVTFWMLVYFLRMLCNKEDQHELDIEEEAARDCEFAQKEVSEFRDIFTHWAEVERTAQTKGHTSTPTARGSGSRKSMTLKSLSTATADDSKKYLTIDGMTRMLRSLNVVLHLRDLTELEQKLVELDGQGIGQLDFASFLRLMSWLLASNFAGLNSSAEGLMLRAIREGHQEG